MDFAKYQGLTFMETQDKFIHMQFNRYWKEVQDIKYPVYRRMEFNSDRKRMSILLRDPQDGRLKLYIKGADSIILDRLDRNQINREVMKDTEDFLYKASVKGLRTLLMGMKIVEENDFKIFMEQVAIAESNVMQRDKLLATIYDNFEKDIVLLGATAVEDRLQDNVPQTINDLQEAGIKIWMLTGDKLETAENIGFSCRLL